jgi:hypothetical protein
MAAFCKQCSIEMFGEDFGDLSLSPDEVIPAGVGRIELCETCGWVRVSPDGECIDPTCPVHGSSPRPATQDRGQPIPIQLEKWVLDCFLDGGDIEERED